MSGVVASRGFPAPSRRWAPTAARSLQVADPRRVLQLSLAGLWLLDGVLQLQPFMFSKGFARQVLAPAAHGNPAFVAGPITWVAHLVAQHSVGANAGFAGVQVVLGLGIAWRPTVRVALAASILWALSVWWLGEGLGGVLAGNAGPVAGGPGAALLYAVLAVLLWPPAESGRTRRAPFVAGGWLGTTAARLTWLALWGGLAGLAVQGVNRSPQGLHDMVAGMAAGQPAWLAAISTHAAALLADRGLAVSIGLAVALAAIAASIFGPPVMQRLAIALAVLLAATIWLVAEALGGLFGGQGTDPATGPLLIVLALAYWPLVGAADHEAGVG